jgi:hypothetical protein
METDYYEDILNGLLNDIDQAMKLTKAKHAIKAIQKARYIAGEMKNLADKRK